MRVPYKIVNDLSWDEHRSGWNYVLSLINRGSSEDGIIIDGCLDHTFGYKSNNMDNKLTVPYKEKWVGFLHHPINICPWYYQKNLSPQYVLNDKSFLDSLPYCQGIFTFSEYLGNYVRSFTQGKIEVQRLFHPTENVNKKFNFNNFNANRKVVQIGVWMRRLTSIFKIRAEGYQKLLPLTKYTKNYLNNEIKYLNNVSIEELKSTTIVERVSNVDYDLLLSESIVFLDLYDSSANNTIIECILRHTPILVNKIPPVIEYLGEDYPFYYNNLQEAEEIMYNERLIKITHEYMKDSNLNLKLMDSAFLQSFNESSIMNI